MGTTARRRAMIDQAQVVLQKLKDVPCAGCQQRHPHWRMEFDHVRGLKLFAVSESASWLFVHSNQDVRDERMRQLLDEVAKCDVVCANCHLDRTFERGQLGRPESMRNKFVPFGANDPKRWGRMKRKTPEFSAMTS